MILINPNTQQAHKVNAFLGSVEGFKSLGSFGGGSYPTTEERATMRDGEWHSENLDASGNNTLFFNWEKMLCYVVDSSG